MEATSSARTARPARPLRLLSLDGGGIRGLSELFILDAIMYGVEREGNLESEALPADYFDMICGTSTGGLIALLLGRLRMSVPEAIKKYGELSRFVFEDKIGLSSKGKSKAMRLEEAIRKVLVEKLGAARDEDTMLVSGSSAGCKTFVCAVPARNVSAPRLFRSYKSAIRYHPAKIWEVARATSAAPTIIQSIKIGEPGMEEEFVDGGLGNNNPTKLVVQEAIDEYDPERRVGCIVSIGTGRARAAGFTDPKGLQRILPLDLIEVLKQIATDCDKVADEINEKYRDCPGLYHRLNVEVGMDDIALEEWDRLHEVKTHTMAYLERRDMKRKIKEIVDILLGKDDHAIPLRGLDGALRRRSLLLAIEEIRPEYFNYPAYSVTNFVNRPAHLAAMTTLLDGQQTASTSPYIKILVLQGMGGCGKTQLALKYCSLARQVEENENGKREGGQDENDETEKGKNEKDKDGKSKAERRKPKIIVWIDATSPETAMLSFTKVAEAMSKPNFEPADTEANLQYVRKSLDKTSKKWLLVFDNYDDPSSFQRKRIKEFFPSTGPGSILITSRHAEARTLAQRHQCLDVTQLSKEEAINLLLIRTERNTPEQDRTEAEKIVKRLGYHALAIDQAGAYIRSLNLDFPLYLMEYDQERQRLLDEVPDDWDYIKPSEHGTEEKVNYTVFTTLQLSLKLLRGDAQARMDKEHIFTLMAFFDINNLTDTMFVPFGKRNKTWMASCHDSDGWNIHLLRKVLSELHNLSLLPNLDTSSSGASFTIHPLVQDWLKARIGKEHAKQYVVESMLVLSAYLWANGASDHFENVDFHARQFMVAHVDATILAKQEFYESWSFLQGASFLIAGFPYYSILASQGRYHQAVELCGAVLAGWTNESGEEHPEALAAMHNLSAYLIHQGKYDEAELLLRKCVATSIKIRGKEALETLQSIYVLTDLLTKQKKK